jgi:GxxExxY protein
MCNEGAPIFGLGFPEAIYRRALIIELERTGLKCRAEVERDVYYEAHFIGKRRLDLIVEDKVLVEIKALSEMEKASFNQILNYLRVFKIEVGLLLNFGSDSLQYKRLVNTKTNQRNP